MSADDLPFGIVSTDNIKVSERREFWEASAVPLFGQLQLEAPSGQPFDASVAYAGLADLVLCRLSASISHRVVRTDAVARNDNRAYVKAVFSRKDRVLSSSADAGQFCGPVSGASMTQLDPIALPFPTGLRCIS
jgi:hypothetical protein